MKKPNKMNFLYKIAFIILMLAIPLTLCAVVTAYLLGQVYLSAVFSASGAFLMFVGIILSMFSKPKKVKKSCENQLDNKNPL